MLHSPAGSLFSKKRWQQLGFGCLFYRRGGPAAGSLFGGHGAITKRRGRREYIGRGRGSAGHWCSLRAFHTHGRVAQFLCRVPLTNFESTLCGFVSRLVFLQLVICYLVLATEYHFSVFPIATLRLIRLLCRSLAKHDAP